jgi:hypothetical protein
VVAAGAVVAHAQPGDRVDCSAMAEVPVHNDALPSLTRQLGLFLEEAEALFGPRDRSFMLLGIEFTDGPNRLVYPNTHHDQIIIQLSNESRDIATRHFFSSRMKPFMSYHRLMWVQLPLLRKDLQPTSV